MKVNGVTLQGITRYFPVNTHPPLWGGTTKHEHTDFKKLVSIFILIGLTVLQKYIYRHRTALFTQRIRSLFIILRLNSLFYGGSLPIPQVHLPAFLPKQEQSQAKHLVEYQQRIPWLLARIR